MSQTLVEKFKTAAKQMFVPGDHVLVAVSGGADSLALLILLNDWKNKLGIRLSVAHLDHMTRAGQSSEDARFVASLCEKMGLHAVVEQIDVAKEKKALKTSFQESARILRYRFLHTTLKRLDGQKIAIGHTADDQVETLLMHLIRGSGLKGLAGIPRTRGAIVRPLHACFRWEIEAHLKSLRVDYLTDSSNLECEYIRNRVRLELIPQLENFNPSIKSVLLETAAIVRDEEDCLRQIAEDTFAKLCIPFADGLGFSLEAFAKETLAIRKRLVRQAVNQLCGDLRRLSSKNVQAVLDLTFNPGPGKQIQLPGGMDVICGYENVEFKKNFSGSKRILTHVAGDDISLNLVVPGITPWPQAKLQFETAIMDDGEQPPKPDSASQAIFDGDKTGKCLKVRFFRPGDRFIPLGMTGHKKLKDFFIDEKIPRDQRKTIPILTTANGDVIWVVGKRISESYRATDVTRRILVIRTRPVN